MQPYLIDAASNLAVETHHYLIYAGLGAICALLGIVLMRAVAVAERASRRTGLPDWARPALGGALLIPIAMVSPQVLSAGHGALHADLALGASVGFIVLVLVAKSAASIVSLGFGFMRRSSASWGGTVSTLTASETASRRFTNSRI